MSLGHDSVSTLQFRLVLENSRPTPGLSHSSQVKYLDRVSPKGLGFVVESHGDLVSLVVSLRVSFPTRPPPTSTVPPSVSSSTPSFQF